MKKTFLLLFIAVLLLAGCSEKAEPTNELWVLTEQSTMDGMNLQAKQAIAQFRAEHKDIAIRLEILPIGQEERELYFRRLRTQIMAGQGPDVYLLPTGGELILTATENFYATKSQYTVTAEPLFWDVEQAMRLGIFADLQALYAADTDLHTEQLRQAIMDAGVVDGKRYVLPLRFSLPVLLLDAENPYTQALCADSSAAKLAEQLLALDDDRAGIGMVLPTDYSALPPIFDYARGEMLITPRDIAEYMLSYQAFTARTETLRRETVAAQKESVVLRLMEEWPDFQTHEQWHSDLSITLEDFNKVRRYMEYNMNWVDSGLPCFSTSLVGALESAVLKKGRLLQTESYPLRASDGSVGAQVTYFGAVGVGCKEPALAYEFLRLFLTEDYQWESVRSQKEESRTGKTEGFIENSWPVRTEGSASGLYQVLRYQYSGYDPVVEHKPRRVQMLSGVREMSDEDMPILDVPIDHVCFPFYQPEEETLAYALAQLNNPDGTPTDADIGELSESVYRYLWWHLAEG